MAPAIIAGGLQGLFGLGQSLFSGRAKAEKDLEKYANSFQPNQSIMDFYNKALARYNPNPYSSQQYQQQNNQIQRNLTTAIGASQDRRSAISSIAAANQMANDSSARAVGDAERASGADLARLGQAAGMKTNEQQKKFDLIYNLKAAKAGQAAVRQNSGIRNLYGGLNTVANAWNDEEDGSNNSTGLTERMPNPKPELISYRKK